MNATQINTVRVSQLAKSSMSDKQQNVVKALMASGWYLAWAMMGDMLWIDGTRCNMVKGGTVYGIVGTSGQFEITVVQGEESTTATTVNGLRTLVA